jgi:alpha-tubulin suppressor-like RCC1 family protein
MQVRNLNDVLVRGFRRTGVLLLLMLSLMAAAAGAASAAATSVSTGGESACAIDGAGAVQCWGDGYSGQLGPAVSARTATPVTIPLAQSATSVSIAYTHACAVLADASVACWGNNAFGQLGDGTTNDSSTPVSVTGLSATAVKVSVGGDFSCALLTTGAVQCWGNNGYGQLGNGSAAGSLTPVTVSGISTALQLSTGDGHACVKIAGNNARCWGLGDYGILGNGTSTSSNVPVAPSLPNGSVKEISAGYRVTCALRTNGSASCWGWNDQGELGNGKIGAGSGTPVNVVGLGGSATHISVGGYHACAQLTTGTVRCWGQNNNLQLGNLAYPYSAVPVSVGSLGSSATGIFAGSEFNCANLANGHLRCWGSNNWDELGAGDDMIAQSPVPPTGLVATTSISSLTNHNCAISVAKDVWCWGWNLSGQIGNGRTLANEPPTKVTGLGGQAKAVAVGVSHSCAIRTDNVVRCWGAGDDGALGNGTKKASTTPVTVLGIGGTPKQISAGDRSTCVVLTTGVVKCWGTNGVGQLGNGSSAAYSTIAVPTATLNGTARSVSLNAYGRACALLTTGEIRCWGGSRTPVDESVSGGTPVSLSVGDQTSCGVMSDGTVHCWGDGSRGQLGDGTNVYAASGVTAQVPGTAVSVAVGEVHACAATTTGAVYCWGANFNSQLGDGTTTDVNVPILVALPGSATAVSAGFGYSCALLSAGGTSCWGANDANQSGGGLAGAELAPQTVVGF